MSLGLFSRRHAAWRGILKIAALCVVLQFIAAGAAQAAWWNGDWQYRVKIDADAGPKGANVGEPIGRTQVLVRLLANNFKFDTAKQDGSDIRFVAGDDRTPLHYHIEKFDGLVDQVALIWVDVPDLAPGATTNFFMYWGNEKANDASDAHATYDADQLLVWHFGEENGLPKDSTSYANNALTPGRRDQTAIIGFGSKLDGTAPIKLTPNPTLNIAAAETLTWQLWIKPNPATETGVVYDQRDAAGVNDFEVSLAGGIPQVVVTSATGALKAAATAPLVADSWHLLTVTGSADKITLFVDGAKAAEVAGSLPAINGGAVLGGSAAAAPAPAAAVPPAPGAPPAAAPTAEAAFIGEVDELQISKAVRPTGAILLADRDQGTQSNLIAFEAPEQTSSFGSGYIGIILKSVTIDAWVIIGILIFMMLVSWWVMAAKAAYVSRVAGANKKFLVVLRDINKRSDALLPAVPRDRVKGMTASCLYRVYETGVREVEDRLAGGRHLPDGTIAPQSLAAIRSSMDAQMVREQAKLNNLMVFLTIAISGGPFVGLLGTVVGVMITFAAIAAAGDVNVNSIAPGISAALLATATGMFVAIPALFGYNYFQVRIKGVISEMQVFVDEVVTRIAEGEYARNRTQPGAAE
jgi:biopolymer transport protein ExbB